MGRTRLEVFALESGNEVDLRIPFIFGGTRVNSSIRGFGTDVAVARWTAELPAMNEGTETVRGRSFPFDAMFGVPIWRDRTSDVCASKR